MSARAFVCVLLFVVVLSLGQGALALTDGHEEGSFPHRTFYLVRSPGPPRPDIYTSYMVAPATGEWWLRLDQLAGSAVLVRLYDVRTSPATLVVDSKLRAVGQESSHVRIEKGVGYNLVLSPQGRSGTSVLSEQFRYETSTPPVPCFISYPNPATENMGVHFDGSCSTDAEDDIVAWDWDFGDGQVGSGVYIDHGFRSFGRFNVTLRVSDSAGNAAETSQIANVYADRSSFDPPHTDYGLDTDGDGLFDELVVEVHVAIGANDPYVDFYGRYYRISGYLTLGSTALYDERVVLLNPGFATVELHFDGVGLRMSGQPGPYVVDLSLVHSPTNTLLDSDSYSTQAYPLDAFEDRPAAFEAPNTDAGNDTDGDGKFNALSVDLGVRVARAGSYSVWGQLWDAGATVIIGSAQTAVDLDVGLHPVRLSFPGWQINVSGVDGPYRVDAWLGTGNLRLDATTTDTRAYDRYAFNGPLASFFGAHDDRGIDADGDGTYETLEVNVSVVATAPVTAYLHAVLWAYEGGNASRYIDAVIAYPALVEGLQRVPIRFRGVVINEAGIDGPYVVDLLLSVAEGYDRDVYTTHPYSFRQFLGPVARLVDIPTDYGLDTDGDGRFNFLIVEVPVQVYIPTELSLAAVLDPISETAGNLTAYPVGLQRIVLRFDGVALRASGWNGPFTMRFWLYDNMTPEYLGSGTYTTGAYSYLTFEDPPAIIAGPHADYGMDTDGDGLFNALVVEVHLQVYAADRYTVSASLQMGWPTYRTLYADNESVLGEGPASLRLPFDGVFFRLSGRNQTYSVSMTLWSVTHPKAFAWGYHGTRLYNYTEFQEIPFLLAPPYSDRGDDTDGDGLFNALVVDVPITALQEGSVWISAQLFTTSTTLYASNASHVAAGSTVLRLRFEGWRLRESGAQGPYFVWIALSAGPYGELGRDVHPTGAYASTDFDPALDIDLARTTDRGEDVNGNGLFDYLSVEVAIEVEPAGHYRVAASIRFSSIAYVSGFVDLDVPGAGRWTATVRLSGMALWGIGMDGPYLVNLDLYRFYSQSVSAEYATNAYLAQAFEVPPAIFAPPFSETAADTDGDGLYNVLIVDAPVKVREAGNYSVYACVDVIPVYCRAFAGVSQILEAGTHVVRLEVPGGLIRSIGVDGPYTVRLHVEPTPSQTSDPPWRVYASFETGAYRFEDFEYLASFGAVHDRGIDANGNGLYESLEIQVELVFVVTEWFTLEAYLDLGPNGTVPSRFEGVGYVGTMTVVLTFDAAWFNQTGRDGPYSILLVVSGLGAPASTTYLTAAYRASDFGL